MQIQNANDLSPVSLVVGSNSNAKGAATILLKNGVIQQSIATNATPSNKVFNPVVIDNGDTLTVQIN